MSLESHLEKLKSILSQEDQSLFEEISDRINQANGDFSVLTEEDRLFINKMDEKYGDKIRAMAVENVDEVAGEHHGGREVIPDEFPLLKTEFADYVRDMLLRELGEQHPDLKSAVCFAYENKWLPAELQNPDVCETLFERFFADIQKANEWREQFHGQQLDNDNKPLAIGLTWFMYIFQLKQWVEKF